MSQNFQVLKCFNCDAFQVHFVKKSKKWECKMCGSKQSLIRNYGVGSAIECRLHVQKLNEMRINLDSELPEPHSDKNCEDIVNMHIDKERNYVRCTFNKWSKYVDEDVPDEGDDDMDEAKCSYLKRKRYSENVNESIVADFTNESVVKSKRLCYNDSFCNSGNNSNKEPHSILRDRMNVICENNLNVNTNLEKYFDCVDSQQNVENNALFNTDVYDDDELDLILHI